MKISTAVFVGIAVMVVLATAIVFAFSLFIEQESGAPSEITNFWECMDAGYAVMESHPRQCRTADGDTFTEDIGNELEKHDMIRVAHPRPNQVISSPLEMWGEARGNWFFEADFPVALYDADGNELASGFVTATEEWMTEHFVPFQGMIEFDVPATAHGTLVFTKDNPADDRPDLDDELVMPVFFQRNQ